MSSMTSAPARRVAAVQRATTTMMFDCNAVGFDVVAAAAAAIAVASLTVLCERDLLRLEAGICYVKQGYF